MAYCRNCGAEMTATAKFCQECGQDQSVSVPQDQRIQTEDVPVPPPPAPTEAVSATPPPQRGGALPTWTKGLLIIGALIVLGLSFALSPLMVFVALLVLIVAVVVLIFRAFRGRPLRNWSLVAAAALLLFFAYGGVSAAMFFGESGSAGTEGPGAERTFTSDDYAELASDPNSFRGASVDVTGRVLRNAEVRGDTTVFQMFADPENSDWSTLVRSKSAPEGITSGDIVRVQGTVQGAREGENLMGGTVRSVEIEADSVEMVEERQSKTKSR